MAEQWHLLFTLPNLATPVPTPFDSGGGYVICSADDFRLENLASTKGNDTALKMLDSFRTPRGEKYKPGCFLIRADIPIARRTPEAIRAFRNVCSISATTAAYAIGLDSPQNAQWVTHWSDQFLFGYFTAGKNGWVQTLDGAVGGMDDKIPSQQPASQFGRPSDFSLRVDEPLLYRLFRCWRLCYMQRRDRGKLRRLFRALEVAFHASLFPADGLTSINDVGTRLALWVSAFEVLCHPGGKVDKRIVQQVISAAPFARRELRARRYTISYQRNLVRVTLAEALYDDLYFARNQFLHGLPVRDVMLNYRQSAKYETLQKIAPVLFNAALVTHLNNLGIPGGPTELKSLTRWNLARYIKTNQGLDRIQDGLIAAGKARQHF